VLADISPRGHQLMQERAGTRRDAAQHLSVASRENA
jgi:hypothetical protein